MLIRCTREATPYRSSAVPTPELIDELYREEVLDARKMTGEEKLLLGQQLFEAACRITSREKLEEIRRTVPKV